MKSIKFDTTQNLGLGGEVGTIPVHMTLVMDTYGARDPTSIRKKINVMRHSFVVNYTNFILSQVLTISFCKKRDKERMYEFGTCKHKFGTSPTTILLGHQRPRMFIGFYGTLDN